MAEFLQTYGLWIFLGLMLVLMFRGHGAGCCGSGRRQPVKDENKGADTSDSKSGGCH